ncbi:hypothetical protein Q5O14_15050 [Eubacteriaceae bacterium ES2]|nr:hypothetical protein Q5O14_15050 [Eubacteriaceae bacterium ES2]
MKKKRKFITTYNENGELKYTAEILEDHGDGILTVECISYFDMIYLCSFGGVPDQVVIMENCMEMNVNELPSYKIHHSFLTVGAEFIKAEKNADWSVNKLLVEE